MIHFTNAEIAQFIIEAFRCASAVISAVLYYLANR